MRTYKYVGDGAGIPGLPHIVTDAEANLLGVEEILAQAIEAKVYVEVKEHRAPPAPKEGE